jgi:signal transduction histidine kinase
MKLLSVGLKAFLIFCLCISHAVQAQVDTAKFKRLSDSLNRYIHSDTDKAFEILKEMDAVSAMAPISKARIEYLNQMGALKRMSRDIAGSIKLHQESIEKSRKLKDEESLVRSMFNLAVSYGDAGELTRSIQAMREIEEKINAGGKDYNIRTKLYANLTSLYASLKEEKSAYRYNNLLKNTMENRKDSLSYYLMQFYLLENDEKFSETIELGNEVFTKIEKIESYYLYQFNFYLGQAYLKLNDYDNGAKYLFRAKEIAELLKVESASFYAILADYYKDTKDYNKAILYYNKLATLSIEEGSLVHHMDALNGLALSYEKTGQFKKGLEMKNKAVVLSDSLNGIERRKAILDLDSKYDLKAKQDTIRRNRAFMAIQEKQLSSERRLNNVSLGFVIVFFIFSALLYLSYKKLRQTNVALSEERKNLTVEKKKLIEINKVKDKLFAVISHDLRSPIASLANTLTLYNEEKQSKPLQNTLLSLSNIQLILSNLLNWANLQIRDSDPSFSQVNVSILMDTVIGQVDSQARAKSIDILPTYAGDEEVWTDEHFLQIVLRNILTNAIKFTPEEGVIKIALGKEQSRLSIKIRDSGIGISAEKLPEIFSYPRSLEGTTGEKGTGLGLTLSKELVDKIEGEITIKSKPNVGTEVNILLPLKESEILV